MEKEFLTKEDLLFDRDEKGELLPVTKKIGEKNIVFLPVARGEWSKLISDKTTPEKDKDAMLLEKHLIEPKIKYDELIKFGKNNLITKIITMIINESNKSFDDTPKVPQEKKDISMKQK